MDEITKWSINESLLQSYRSIFISSQSFLLAVGAIVVGKSTLVLFATAAVSQIMIFMIWMPVVVARHRIVDYYKFGSSIPPEGRLQICTEREYVHDRVSRVKANEVFGIRGNWRPTRLKLDLGIPLLFSLVWIVLMIQQLREP
ncbi:MAG: hypothetical protein HY820_32820 [Acidobacteria bacterium]|nr:hypothetical protein [Acidobacteriota bacterium]